MINFNFAVKVGFVALSLNETLIGMKVRHRNNGMFHGTVSEILENGKIMIFTEGQYGIINQEVDPEKFMLKDRDYVGMIGHVARKKLHDQRMIDQASEDCDFEKYSFYKERAERKSAMMEVIMYEWENVLGKFV